MRHRAAPEPPGVIPRRSSGADTTGVGVTGAAATDAPRLAPELADRVRRRLAAQGGQFDSASVAAVLRAETSGVIGDLALLDLLREAESEFVGAGPLSDLLADPEVTDVLVNAPDQVWVDRGLGLQRCSVRFADDAAVRRLAQRLAASAGRRLDDAQPWLDATLRDGTRLHAVLPPVAAGGTHLSLRTLRTRAFDIDELQMVGTLTHGSARIVRAMLAARLSFLICGGTGSGKTTMLAALLGEVAAQERIVTVEDAAELAVRHPHVVSLVGRPPNVEGAGEVTLRDLVRQALRMRPDRIVVGEVRGAEVVDLLAALNTGHDGGCGTIHANGPEELPARLEALAALGGMGRQALHAQLAAAVQVALQLRRDASGQRTLAEVWLLGRVGDQVVASAAWRYGTGSGPAASALAALMSARGVSEAAPDLLAAGEPGTVLAAGRPGARSLR